MPHLTIEKVLKTERVYCDPKEGNVKHPFPSINDPPTLDLSVIVPAYNEEERMTVMLNECLDHLEERQKIQPSFQFEVIIVDDGSKDKTSQIGLTYSEKYGVEKVRVLTLAKNRGKGGAIRMGVVCARGRLILFADADGATKFQDLKKLEDEMHSLDSTQEGMAIVCGSRAHLEKDSIAERALFRTILMVGFHFLVGFLCVKGIKDTQCGFKLLTREAARVAFFNLHIERWAFDVDLLYIAQYFKMSLAEVAVTWTEIEGSKLSPLWSSIQMGRDLFLIRLYYMFHIWRLDVKPKIKAH